MLNIVVMKKCTEGHCDECPGADKDTLCSHECHKKSKRDPECDKKILHLISTGHAISPETNNNQNHTKALLHAKK